MVPFELTKHLQGITKLELRMTASCVFTYKMDMYLYMYVIINA
jgi:hypothetical protein